MEYAQYYRHFKGGLYRFISTARDSENPEREMVVYQAMYGENDIWVRPKEMFLSTVERDGYFGPRFIPIDDKEAALHLKRLKEAKRQIDSTLSKLKGVLSTLEAKEEPSKYKSQITLTKRRIDAFGLASQLVNEQIKEA